jgi:pimeloyl-ACP methyl ester carboxylesterase
MAIATRPPATAPTRPPTRPAPTAAHPRGRPVATVATVGLGVGLGYLVSRSGTPHWQLVRLLVTAGLTGVALLGQWRLGATGRALLALASGLVGTAVGLGIAVPHLAKSGMMLTTAAGILTLASGVVLLVLGGASLVRRARPWHRLVVVPALLVALFVSVWTLGQATLATNVPRTEVGAAIPADRGLAYADVAFGTADGVTLRGWYVPSDNGAAVVLLHGAGSTRSNVLDHAAVLADHGYGVLAFDARGHGGSEGRAMDFGWYGDDDVAAAVSFLVEQPDVDADRIAAVGMSMGGEEAVGAAAADDRIRAVVAEGAQQRVAADKRWLSDEYGPAGWLQEQLDRLTFAATDLLTEARPPIALRDAVAATRAPVLLIAAGDEPDEAHSARFVQEGSPATVEVWVVPGAGHTDGLATSPAAWERRVTGFLAEALDLGLERG